MKKNRTIMKLLIALAVLIVITNTTKADKIIDLTTVGSSGTVNDAWFYQTNFVSTSKSTGTGVIDPFMRLQSKGNSEIEQGFNSDAGDFLDVKDSHSIQINDIPLVTLNGVNYREFLLDINQGNPTLLSLDKLEIYLNPSANLTSLAGLSPIWQLDTSDTEDAWIKMDYELNPGSGKGDIFAYIPESIFDSTKGSYVYLYSLFGENYKDTSGFEEWAVRLGDTTTQVPVPGAFVLGMLGLIVAGKKLRKYA